MLQHCIYDYHGVILATMQLTLLSAFAATSTSIAIAAASAPCFNHFASWFCRKAATGSKVCTIVGHMHTQRLNWARSGRVGKRHITSFSRRGRQMLLLRHSKRNNLVVFGFPEFMAYSLPAELASHMQ